MAIKINSNGQSLSAQHQVAQTGDALSRVYERLSSGQRINRASDDAAGLAIADTLNAKTRIYTAGVRNLNDGVSVLSVADSAVSSLTNITVRLKELAEQSANGVYSSTQRKAIDTEAQALSKEFTRVTQSTTFNGLNLFDGSVQGLSLQAGAGVDGSIFSTFGGAKGTGTFQDAQAVPFGDSISAMAVGDFNGDGILDFVASETAGITSVFIGKGDDTFTETGFAGGGIASAFAVADINGDGKLDILEGSGGVTQTFLGKGDGTFNTLPPASTTQGFSLTTGDVDGDGIVDLIAADHTSNIRVLRGQGNGTFAAAIILAAGGNVQSVALGDLNGDGILDVVGSDASGNLNFFTGKGNGTFNSRTTIVSGSSGETLTLADLNNDGLIDIVTNDYVGNALNVLLGTGSGNFASRQSFQTGSNPLRTQVGDFNGDGNLDIISADAGTSDIGILLGKGDGTFSRTGVSDYLGSPNQIIACDINGDGVLDILSGDDNGNLLSLLGKSQDGISSLTKFSLKTKNDSLQAINIFDKKLQSLSAQRGIIGAFQSRITTAINVLQSANENFKAAESRIRDTDIAKDSAELVRLGILQQAGVSVLSQANSQPQLALKLLQN